MNDLLIRLRDHKILILDPSHANARQQLELLEQR